MARTAEERRKFLQSWGYIAPDNDGFFGELADSAAQSFVSGARGVGATINELTGNSSMQDYFQGVLNRNQQWNAPEDGSVGSYIGRAVGSAAGSTVATLTAATAGTLLGGPGAGVAAGVTTAFAQTFGDNVQRNREAGYSENKALGMAFLESGIDAAIENLPFGIVGKSGKVIAQAGRLRNISAAGKRELLNAVGKRVAAATGQKETQSTLARLGKAAFMNGLGEGGEEGLQTLNSYLNQTLGGDTRANITIEELADSIAQGFIGGFFLGGVQSAPLAFTRTSGGNAGESQLDTATPAPSLVAAEGTVIDVTPLEDTPQATVPENNSLFEQLVANAGEYLGIKVDYMDSLPNGEKIADENNGMYDSKNKTLYLNRQSATVNPVKTLGHELKHYLDDNHPELAKTFDELVNSGLTELGQNFNKNIHKGDMAETASDIFGDIFARPDTWSKVAVALDEKTPGMGEAFLKVLQDFIAHIKDVLKGNVQDPQAEQLLNNFEKAEAETVKILAEIRRRNGTASQVENVVGAKGNTAVETVPVADINVDAERFQFKSHTSKSSGVDESNKLGGDWDPRTAGNLYLWQDKSGKMYVVNGHHRLELARRNNVENLNAIIDRETDGVTAEQARRNGVLINIRDGQGEVRDYAAFVRSEKLSEDEAKAQGVTARQKGRAGFALGKSGDTLYEAYRNEEIPESKAVIIAEVAQGNEAIEYAGIRLAVDRKLAGEALRQTLKLAAQNSSGKKNTAAQDSLFDMVDDTVLKEWELIGKAAATHIKEIRSRIEAAKDAIKNPEAAKSLGVKTSKGAEKLLAQAQEELTRWENYATDPELMAQLRKEANIAPQEDVAGAKNAQTSDTVETGSAVDAPVVKDNLTTEKAATPKENLEVAATEIKNTTDRYRTKGENPTYYKSFIEVEQAEKAAKSKGQKFEYEKNPDYVPAQKKQAEQAAQEASEVPDNPAVGESFNEFYKRFTPQLESILAKNKQMFSRTIGNKFEDEWSSEASKAIVKAYGKFNSDSRASVDTYVSRAIENAIKSVNRKHNAEFVKTGGGVSLNQTNEKGEELQEAVTAEDAEFSSKIPPGEKLNDYTKWKSTLKPRDQKILTYSEQGLAPSEIARKSGIGMTQKEVTARIRALKTAALTEEEFLYSRKRIYTGSAADYDKPSLQYIGTGEGQQAYGWGLYGSESEKVARWYAEEDADRKNYSSATVIKYMGTPYTEKELFDYAKAGDVDFQMLAHVFSRGGVQNAIHELEQQVERAKQKNWHPELYKWQEDLLKEIREAQDDIEYIENKLEGKRNLYNQTFWPNKDEDLLDWNDVLTDEQRDKILKQGSKEGVFKLDRTEQPQEVLNALQAIRDEIQYDDRESSFFYKKLSTVLGSPKAASEFLYRAGIDGITYIGDSSGVRNYVAFSDKDIQVDEHIKYSKKRSSRQIVPIVREGVVRDEYADLLSKRKYTVQTLEELQGKAMEWIKQNGGVVASVNVFLKGNAPGNPAVAEIARRLLLESDVFQKAFSKEQRTKLFEQEQDVREDWGRTGRAMQLAALSLKDIASVQAVLNKLHKKMKDDEVITLRNQILKELGIDIIDLPDDIIEDRKKLDAVLREHLAYAAGKAEKFYEYYIHAILSGPTTLISDVLGNTANAAYELGIKRFTEALVNIAAGRKDGATFGEFREMIRAFNWRNAMAEARKAYDLEVLDPSGKFLGNNMVAIGGKTGRVIRVPGRALKAADAFASALIRPMEIAAYAYRMGVQEGLSGSNLQAYIREQLHDPDSKSYQWGVNRARELTFQEDPGSVVRHLINLRESDGAMGIALKMFLPFIKTPYNILRQGMRKGPVGTVNLAFELGKVALGKRKFDGEMVGRVAEQLLAWGAFMAVYGLSDDDDELPILTGTSAPYGSAEYGFKANKIPPYSIRLGDTWYSYQRIEPLATGLAAIADGIQAMREIKSGKDASAALKKMLFSTIKVAGEKSYIDSINEIVKIAQDPERNMARPATNLLSSIMPALIRQTRQAFIEEVGESKSRNMGVEWWKDQFDLIINRAGITTAIPKVDYFGRDVKKDDWSTSMLSDAGRLLPIKRVEADRNMGNAERLIWNYNRRNPDEEYYPSIPRNTFTHNGVKMYFAGDDYREFAVQSGQLAHKQINNAIRAGRLNVENPTEKDIKLIRKIFTRARKETQDKLLQQKRGNQL